MGSQRRLSYDDPLLVRRHRLARLAVEESDGVEREREREDCLSFLQEKERSSFSLFQFQGLIVI